MAVYIGLLCYLILAAGMDMKTGKVSVWLAFLVELAAVGNWMLKKEPAISVWLLGFLPGLCLLAVSYGTKEAIGYGDGIVVLILGTFLGFFGCLEVLVTGMLLTCPVSLILVVCKKAGRRTRMPFIPFLLAGYGIWLPAVWKMGV